MKRYFTEYESDKIICQSNKHIAGFASTIKTAKSYISRVRKREAEYNPRNFKVYDTCGECEENEHVPSVYEEVLKK